MASIAPRPTPKKAWDTVVPKGRSAKPQNEIGPSIEQALISIDVHMHPASSDWVFSKLFANMFNHILCNPG
jgi:hypothetical protein